MEQLVDSYGRRIKSMRISITDKCNFRCTYCMPAEGLPWLKKAEILSYEEIERITRVGVSIGIEQIRLTGGEPLVRRDVPELVGCQAETAQTLDLIQLAYKFWHIAVNHWYGAMVQNLYPS